MNNLATYKQRLIYAITIIIMSILLSSGFAIWYVTYQNQKWCDVLGILTAVDPSTQVPPTTPSGKQSRQVQIQSYKAFVHTRKSFHCGGG